MKYSTRIVSVLMTVALLVTMLSVCAVTVLADDPVPNEDVVIEEVSEEPTEEPAEEATETPSEEPAEETTETPSEEPAEEPTAEPTAEPTEEATETPSAEPTEAVTEAPSEEPTEEATEAPTRGLLGAALSNPEVTIDFGGTYNGITLAPVVKYDGDEDSVAFVGTISITEGKLVNVTANVYKTEEDTEKAKTIIHDVSGVNVNFAVVVNHIPVEGRDTTLNAVVRAVLSENAEVLASNSTSGSYDSASLISIVDSEDRSASVQTMQSYWNSLWTTQE